MTHSNTSVTVGVTRGVTLYTKKSAGRAKWFHGQTNREWHGRWGV